MFAATLSCAVRGVQGIPVAVEADTSNGLPQFTIVGLTDRAIQEARERVRAAMRNGEFGFPQMRVTVNLAPAEIPKEGTCHDLSIALAVLRCQGRELGLTDTAALGELALDGAVRPVLGVLPMARALRAFGCRRLLVPAENAPEAALVDGLEVIPVASLRACVEHLTGHRTIAPAAPLPAPPHENDADSDVLDAVRGQVMAKRALEVAAAGGHALLMTGPPGSGKTMLARALAGLLPDLDDDAALEVASIHSLVGALRARPVASSRPPFRAPHHSVSRAGLIGGGSGLARPGEVSLAHRGTLFLDELREFPRPLLESLRQPLEARTVTIARAGGVVVLPADFVLVAASNPCPCGYRGDDGGQPCSCGPAEIHGYAARLSGPMRDRIDIAIRVPRPDIATLFAVDVPATGLAPAVRGRVAAARERSRAERGVTANGALEGRRLLAACRLTAPARKRLQAAGERLGLSGRAVHRVLRVARTIADLDARSAVGDDHVAEALALRCGDTG